MIKPAGPDWFWYLRLRCVLNVCNCCWLQGKNVTIPPAQCATSAELLNKGDCCRCARYSVDDKWNATLTGRKWTVLAAAACAVRLGFLASRRQGGRQEAARDKGRRETGRELWRANWSEAVRGSNVSDFIFQSKATCNAAAFVKTFKLLPRLLRVCCETFWRVVFTHPFCNIATEDTHTELYHKLFLSGFQKTQSPKGERTGLVIFGSLMTSLNVSVWFFVGRMELSKDLLKEKKKTLWLNCVKRGGGGHRAAAKDPL